MPISITLLQDTEHGGPANQPATIANLLAGYIRAAQSNLHIAVYDFRLDANGPLYAPVIDALKDRARAGVEIKIAFDHGRTKGSAPGADPAENGTAEFLAASLAGTTAEFKGITDRNPLHLDPRLMHSKYIVLDAGTANASVLTGSTNFTDDSWTLEENTIVQVPSPEMAAYYETDFQELWSTGDIESTGANDFGTVAVSGVPVDIAFSPGEGNQIDHHVAQLIASARQRIKLASMLISSHAILGALQRAIENQQVGEFAGVYDATQMDETIENWKTVPQNHIYIPIFQGIATRLAAKVSVPYTPTGKHNFMHIKAMVCDDNVLVGSYNLSHSATMNAENALIIHDKQIADRYSAYVDQLVAQYGHAAS